MSIFNPSKPQNPWVLVNVVKALVKEHPAAEWGEPCLTTGEWPSCSIEFVIPDLVATRLATDGQRWTAYVSGFNTKHTILKLMLQEDRIERQPIDLLAARVADAMQVCEGGALGPLPSWLIEPVREHIRQRASAALGRVGEAHSKEVKPCS